MPTSNGIIDDNAWQSAKGHYRLVIMGAAQVGKTAIVHQFLYDQFSSEYRATVEELYRGEYDLRNCSLVLDILDTSGSFQFPAMRKLAINTGDAFILVYSIDDYESFEEVRRLKDMLIENMPNENTPIVVVGNKCDLEKDRVVMKEVAETIISIDWENRFVESSAKDNTNIVNIFKELLHQVNFPYDLSPAVQRRRTSLPHNQREKNHTISKKIKKMKLSSCAVS